MHARQLKNPDGSWKFTNRLAGSSSQYLLQHAHNPVDWRPWGPEAIEEAGRLGKPIFLSVGYSTCYWCHVMEREVFEDPRIAERMNDWFVCMKVDREQRPDVDEVYMTATQLTTGHGGWPNSLFLTPQLKPFYAGTYFGPVDQYGRPGFPRVLAVLHAAWTEQREEVLKQSEEVAQRIRQILGERLQYPAGKSGPAPDRTIVESAVNAFKDSYDPRDGGFGLAPKFPQGFIYPFLCDVARRTNDQSLRGMVTFSLARMAQGGMCDQVGGGFHRYSTDARWLVPHFEKMLYDQALLTEAYVSAYELTGQDSFRRIVDDVFAFIAREMTGPSGEFYSAIDAETDAAEGKFYVWNESQIDAALTSEQRDLFVQVYALAEVPEIPGHHHAGGGVVCRRDSVEMLAAGMGVDAPTLLARLAPIRATLLAERRKRDRPLLDTKVITSWNAMMIEAMAGAGAALGNPDYVHRAARAATFALQSLRRPDGRLWRVWREGKGEIAAFQEDYVLLAKAFMALHSATGEKRWLDESSSLMGVTDRLFWDAEHAGYFFGEPDAHVIVRAKSPGDGAVPSGNSVAAHVLLDLYERTGDPCHLARADELFALFAPSMEHAPTGLAHMVHALERRLSIADPRVRAGAPVTARPDFIDRLASPDARPLAGGAPSASGIDAATHVRATPFVSLSAIAPGRTFRLALRLDIEHGWHLNANPASQAWLIPLGVDVRCDFPVASFSVEYPPGSLVDLAGVGERISVYEGRIHVFATVTPASDWTPASDQSNAGVRVVYALQACCGGECAASVTRTIALTLPIAKVGESIAETHPEIFSREAAQE